MSMEENIRVLEEATKAFAERDWERFNELHDESVVVHSPVNPEPLKGLAAHREQARSLMKAFPDLTFERERVFGHGDWVCEVNTLKATHKGPLTGPTGEEIPPTNKPVQFQTCNVIKVVEGKIMEEHSYYDALGVMAQLGVVPESDE